MKASYYVYQSHANDWVCVFCCGGYPDTDAHGTDGTGCKLYATKEKAEAAGKRYLKKMQKNGFEI